MQIQDYYQFKKECSTNETTKFNLMHRLNELINIGSDDFQVEIKPLSKRSASALRTYWMLVSQIVKWDSLENGLKKHYFHHEFMKEVGLVEEVDQMKFWKMMYKNEIHENPINKTYYTTIVEDVEDVPQLTEIIPLGKRYVELSRSIADKGDITKDEMEYLIRTALKFGDENIDGWVGIEDVELKRMLSHRGWKEE